MFEMNFFKLKLWISRHSRESGNPGFNLYSKKGYNWIPAFAGMTTGAVTFFRTFVLIGLTFLCLFEFGLKDAFADRVYVTAGVRVRGGGGAPGGGPLTILHGSPVPRASLVRRDEIIVQGEVGSSPRNLGAVPFSARLTPFSNFGSPSQRKIRIRVIYEFVNQFGVQEVSLTPAAETPAIEGPENFGFAFQIPPNAIAGQTLRYRIEAMRLPNGPRETFPRPTSGNPTPWINVGISANANQVFDANGGRIVLRSGNINVGDTVLNIPAGVLHQPTTISIDEVPLTNAIIPGCLAQAQVVYRVESSPSIYSAPLHYTLGYTDFHFPQGQTGILNGLGVQEQTARVFWWDGFTCRILGGVGDHANNTLALKGNFFGFLAIGGVAALSAQDRVPTERVITPNGDGINDFAIFGLSGVTQNVKVEIFDITNHRVRTIMSASLDRWDGRDDSGKIVETGPYIYQYELDGQRVSGLIVVAK